VAVLAFTPQLRRFIADLGEIDTDASSAARSVEAAFVRWPRLRGYVLDDQGHLRANVVIFIDGRRCGDRKALAEPLLPHSRVHVLQALSGG
jgi:sulfur-carrier protein